MTRFEIIANGSVKEEISEALEAAIPDFYYTIIPVVHGRGREARRLGSAIWPEENFMLIAYVDDPVAETVRSTIAGVKAKFPTEGIKLFELRDAG